MRTIPLKVAFQLGWPGIFFTVATSVSIETLWPHFRPSHELMFNQKRRIWKNVLEIKELQQLVLNSMGIELTALALSAPHSNRLS